MRLELLELLELRRLFRILLVGVLLAGLGGAGSPGNDQPVANPHWSPAGCVVCHEGQSPPYQTIAHARVDALCWQCHDGKHAPQEVHPVGRTFAGEGVKRPEGWPVLDGRLSCLTCHDVLQACDAERRRPQENAAFLRGDTGPPSLRFCAQCHTTAAQESGPRNSPHFMLNEDGTVNHHVCQFCHAGAMSAEGQMARTENPRLRSDGITLCISCHRRHVDYFEPGHIGHRVPLEIREHMKRFTADRVFSRSPATQPSRLQTDWTGDEILPLGERGRIVCSTCHNPHQAGVFPDASILAVGAMAFAPLPSLATHDEAPGESASRIDLKPTRLRLRGLGKHVCRACHPY